MATVYVTMASATATQAMKVKCVKNQLEVNVKMDAHLMDIATWASAECQPGYEGDDCSQLNYPNIPAKGEQPRLAGGPNIHTRQSVGPITSGAKYGSAQHAQEIRKLEDRLTHGPILSGAAYENAAEVKLA